MTPNYIRSTTTERHPTVAEISAARYIIFHLGFLCCPPPRELQAIISAMITLHLCMALFIGRRNCLQGSFHARQIIELILIR